MERVSERPLETRKIVMIHNPRNPADPADTPQSFGFTVLYDDEGQCNCVVDMVPGGVAERSGQLQLGDYIISVNGVDTRDSAHGEVIDLIKHAGSDLRITVERPVKSPRVQDRIDSMYFWRGPFC